MSAVSNKATLALCLLLVITNFVVIFSYYHWGTGEDTQPYKDQIELLIKQNDSLKVVALDLTNKADSLRGEIKDADSVIIEIDNWYEKELVNITNQPIAADVEFFTNYLSKVDSGFVDSNNSDTIKENKPNLSRTSKVQSRDSSTSIQDTAARRIEHKSSTVVGSKGTRNPKP